MRFSIRIHLMLIAGLMLVVGLGTSRAAAAPPRSAEDIYEDIDKIATQIGDLSIPSLVEPAKRAEAAKYVPALRKLLALAGELSVNPDPGVRAKGPVILSKYRPVLVTLDDAPTIQEVQTQAKSSNPQQAAAARTDLLYGRWIKASADDQPKLADEAAALARDNPTFDPLATALYQMTQIGHPAHPTAVKLEDAILQMKGKAAQSYAEQIQGVRKLRELVNKPLVISGMKFGEPGKDLSTSSYKGKVVLVDFWATWCVPCMRAMPHVQALYKANHDKGLEVIGVSCDDDVPELTKYLKNTPATAWPQLYDGMTPGWNPIATKLGISAIPAMILIDRKGIVRSVEAEQELDTLIPKLLAEPQ
jgi:thiol-disulfide isomerase/thioredoxin